MEFPASPPMPAMAELLPCDIFPMSFLAPVNPDHATDSEQRFPIAAVEAATGIGRSATDRNIGRFADGFLLLSFRGRGVPLLGAHPRHRAPPQRHACAVLAAASLDELREQYRQGALRHANADRSNDGITQAGAPTIELF